MAIVYWIEESATLFKNHVHNAHSKKFECDKLALAFAARLKDQENIVSIDIKFK